MKALKYNLSALLLFSSVVLNAQKIVTGKILNERTQEIIPFVTVSIKNTQNSVSADFKGIFKVNLKEKNPSDTLLFVGVGYKRHTIALSDFTSPFVVYLKEDVKTLNEVSISDKRSELELGNFSIESNVRLLNRGEQYAKRFEMPSTHQYLKEIIIRRDLVYFPHSPETKFRVHIYDENPKTKGPGKRIFPDTIEITDINNSKINIDVSKYNISIHNSPFFVVIETLLIPYNERYRIFRAGEVVNGVREYPAYYEISYQPYFSVRRSKDNDGWILRTFPDSKWSKNWLTPAIKIIVN